MSAFSHKRTCGIVIYWQRKAPPQLFRVLLTLLLPRNGRIMGTDL
jgi:hypothetical protein